MGNNAAFEAFEGIVIDVYNDGILTKQLLDKIASRYRDVDIDRGGQAGTLTNDGLDVDQVILKTYGLVPPAHPGNADRAAIERWSDAMADLLDPIEKGWGW